MNLVWRCILEYQFR